MRCHYPQLRYQIPSAPVRPQVFACVEKKKKRSLLHTSLHNGRFVAGAHREDFEHTACGPQQLLIAVVSHDVNKTLGTPIGKNDEL